MKEIHQNYTNIPCQGRDCKYWGGEFEDIYFCPSKIIDGKRTEDCNVIWHGEHCKKSEEVGKIRGEIYSRAQKAYDDCFDSCKYKKPWIQGGSAFDKIADEWRNLKCPFYETDKQKNRKRMR